MKRLLCMLVFLLLGATAPSRTPAQTTQKLSAAQSYANAELQAQLAPYHHLTSTVNGAILPLSVIFGYDTDFCTATARYGLESSSGGDRRVAYDTLRYYVEHCYQDPLAWQAFGYTDDAVSQMPGGNSRWLNYRKWLFKVLYLKPDTQYYCSDVFSMRTTLAAYFDTTRGYDENGLIAIEKYIITSGKCPGLVSTFKDDIEMRRQRDHEDWRDTVKDSLLTPYDSTLPTLKEIGFEILLGPEYAAVHHGVVPTSVLGRFAAAPNPFDDKVHLTLNLQVPATLTLDVFDALGRRVQQLVPGVFTMNGMQQYTFGGATLPSGTYYVRASVPEGEVETLRIVKH